MYRIINLFILSIFVLLLACQDSLAAWPGSKTQDLVTINGSSYSSDDYMHWWEHWSGKDKKVSHDIQPFIEWKLLVQEALSMELDQSSSLKRKNDVYLKVHRRLDFKNETVDSKIKISEQDRKERFEAEYNPVSFFTFLSFSSEEKVNEVRQSLIEGSLLFKDLINLPESDGGPHQNQQSQFYPLQLKKAPALYEIIGELQVGDWSTVFTAKDLFILARFDKQEAPDPGLYDKKRQTLQNQMVKEQSQRFTSELIDFLWQKYEVQINEDLFAQANGDMEGDILSQPIVTTNKAAIPLSLLVKDIRKENSFRKVEGWEDEKRIRLYRGLLRGMIIEYLITWESTERHYEDTPPFKWTYEHHQEKNLIEELEKLLLQPKVSLPENEINTYYQEHIEDYKDPDLVTLTMLNAEKDLVEKIWQEVSRGSDFLEVANRHEVKLLPLKDSEVGRLSPQVGAVVQKLVIGEVSAPFTVQEDMFVLVKLLGRTDGEYQSLESVKESIVMKLRPRKFQQVRDEYVEMVLANSEIETNHKAWNQLVADQKK